MSTELNSAAPAAVTSEAPPVVPGTTQGTTGTWKDSLPEDVRNSASLRSIQDVQSLAKSYIHAQSMIGADKFVLPKAGDVQARLEILKKMGLPESADKYEVKLAEGAKINPEFLGNFKAKCLEAGILPDQAQGLLNWYNQSAEGAAQAQAQQTLEQSKAAIDGLKKEWGEGYDKQVAAAKAALGEFADPQTAQAIREKYGNDPAVIKLLAKIGNSLGEDKIRGESNVQFGKTPDQAKKEISVHMSDMNGPYMNSSHPGHAQAVAEMAKLFQIAHPET